LRTAGRTADGKQWVAVGTANLSNQLTPITIPLDKVAGEPAFHPGAAVKVEAKCGDPAIEARVVGVLADALTYYGFRVEDGGWTLRVTAEAKDTSKSLQSGISSSLKVAVPEVKGTIELVAPDGSVVATAKHQRDAPFGPGSKFHKKSESAQIIGQRGTDYYDFGGASPGEALRAEAWTNFIRSLPTSAWPRGAWKSDGKYMPLPLTVTIVADLERR